MHNLIPSLVSEVPDYSQSQNYYKLYWVTFIENQILLEQLRKELDERNDKLRNMLKMQESEGSQIGSEERNAHRKKHNRRTAKEISKNEICPYPSCGKYYGSEGSLNLHIKLKHDGGNKTDRERLAKSLVLSFTNSKPLPEISINLPPGAIEEEAKKLNIGLTVGQISEIQKMTDAKFRETLK